MAGHSKWAQIKRQKAVTDAVKSRVFARFARLIALESKKAAGSVSAPALAAVITRAKAANMPKDNIERAVAKGASKDSGDLEQVVYEAYGPSGTAVIVDALTDSRNRTTQAIKLILTQNNLELAAPGAAAWAFTKSADGSYTPNEPLMDVSGEDEEKLAGLLSSLDEQEDVQTVYTNARGYETTRE
ncbi:MAG TPA: YebC/PmpR family DNA-binding transcriptional regulator [Candidatus Paceibacterota bacterium]|nr:YebC/PmpR family DNA-binding transcriptional regulator [Candidatus Paceibacterota bacterium]